MSLDKIHENIEICIEYLYNIYDLKKYDLIHNYDLKFHFENIKVDINHIDYYEFEKMFLFYVKLLKYYFKLRRNLNKNIDDKYTVVFLMINLILLKNFIQNKYTPKNIVLKLIYKYINVEFKKSIPFLDTNIKENILIIYKSVFDPYKYIPNVVSSTYQKYLELLYGINRIDKNYDYFIDPSNKILLSCDNYLYNECYEQCMLGSENYNNFFNTDYKYKCVKNKIDSKNLFLNSLNLLNKKELIVFICSYEQYSNIDLFFNYRFDNYKKNDLKNIAIDMINIGLNQKYDNELQLDILKKSNMYKHQLKEILYVYIDYFDNYNISYFDLYNYVTLYFTKFIKNDILNDLFYIFLFNFDDLELHISNISYYENFYNNMIKLNNYSGIEYNKGILLMDTENENFEYEIIKTTPLPIYNSRYQIEIENHDYVYLKISTENIFYFYYNQSSSNEEYMNLNTKIYSLKTEEIVNIIRTYSFIFSVKNIPYVVKIDDKYVVVNHYMTMFKSMITKENNIIVKFFPNFNFIENKTKIIDHRFKKITMFPILNTSKNMYNFAYDYTCKNIQNFDKIIIIGDNDISSLIVSLNEYTDIPVFLQNELDHNIENSVFIIFTSLNEYKINKKYLYNKLNRLNYVICINSIKESYHKNTILLNYNSYDIGNFFMNMIPQKEYLFRNFILEDDIFTLNEKFEMIFNYFVRKNNKKQLTDLKPFIVNDVFNLEELLPSLENVFEIEDEYLDKIYILIINYGEYIVSFCIEFNYSIPSFEFWLLNKNFSKYYACLYSRVVDNYLDEIYFNPIINYVGRVGEKQVDDVIAKYEYCGIHVSNDGGYIYSMPSCVGPDDKKDSWLIKLEIDLFKVIDCDYILIDEYHVYNLKPVFLNNIILDKKPYSWYNKFGYKNSFNNEELYDIIKDIKIKGLFDNSGEMSVSEIIKYNNIKFKGSFEDIINYFDEINKDKKLIEYLDNEKFAYYTYEELKKKINRIINDIKDDRILNAFKLSVVYDVLSAMHVNNMFLIYDLKN